MRQHMALCMLSNQKGAGVKELYTSSLEPETRLHLELDIVPEQRGLSMLP